MQDEREAFAPFMYIQHTSIPLTAKHGSNSPKFVKWNSKSRLSCENSSSLSMYVVIQRQIAQERQTIMRTKSIFGCYTLRCFDGTVFFMNNMWWYHSSKNQHITCEGRLKTFPQNELNITFYLVFFQYSNDKRCKVIFQNYELNIIIGETRK